MTPSELIDSLWDSPHRRDARAALRAIKAIADLYGTDSQGVLRSLIRHLAQVQDLGLLAGSGSLDQDLLAGLTAAVLIRGRLQDSVDRCNALIAQGNAVLELARASVTTEIPKEAGAGS